jgi:hypothetical protein
MQAECLHAHDMWPDVWVGGVTTKPTAAEHMYSVASQEERRKENSRKEEQKEAGKSRRETTHVRAGPMCV